MSPWGTWREAQLPPQLRGTGVRLGLDKVAEQQLAADLTNLVSDDLQEPMFFPVSDSLREWKNRLIDRARDAGNLRDLLKRR